MNAAEAPPESALADLDAKITQTPLAFGSHQSKIIAVLSGSHAQRVKLTEDDRVRLVTWVDANAPYHHSFIDKRPDKPPYDLAADTGLLAKITDVNTRRCATCHNPQEVSRLDWVDIRRPAGIAGFEACLASPLVRERATLGGNIANASPVGDLTSMLIALGAMLRIEGAGETRELALEAFFLGYKKLDLKPGEFISAILLPASRPFALFNFEKVSKRERLDIAVVNSAASFEIEGEAGRMRVIRARISAGGVAPIPLLLAKTQAYLEGKIVESGTALEAARIAASEAAPISDVRGSADYRRRLLERLVLAHFVRLFPGLGIEEAIA